MQKLKFMCSSRGLRLRLEMEQKTIVVTTIIGSSRPGRVLQIMLDLLCLFALSLSLSVLSMPVFIPLSFSLCDSPLRRLFQKRSSFLIILLPLSDLLTIQTLSSLSSLALLVCNSYSFWFLYKSCCS